VRLQAALTGNLEKMMAEELDRGARAVTSGTAAATNGLKNHLRQLTVTAFGSQRLANAWRGNTYPRPPQASLGAAGTVHTNAPHIIEAFSNAAPVRSKDGFFLAIPSSDAPKQFMGKRVTPSNWNADRYGPLRFVYRAGKASLLVVDGVRRNKSGRVGRQLANAGRNARGGYKVGVASVVMFFLVPQVRFKKVFDLDAAYAGAVNNMVSSIIAAWGTE
jgi:hypothetical protein